MEGIKEKAGRYKRLAKDETFIELLATVKQRQIDVFLSNASDSFAIDDAHNIVLALSEIEAVIDSVIAEESVHDKKTK
jgi:hypothetical protein